MLVQFGGYLGGGQSHQEIWSCNIRVATFGTIDTNSPQDATVQDQENFASALSTTLQTWFATPEASITDQAKLTFLKVNAIGPLGEYRSKTTTTLRDFSPVAGFFGVGQYTPYQAAAVVTLHSDVLRGLGSKGRIYLPCPASTYNVDGRWARTVEVANSIDPVLEAMNRYNGDCTSRVAIVSPGSPITGEGGIARLVTGLSVGDVVDTQRRRRNALVENRQRRVVSQPVL
jgi:hypothetical protein